MPGRSATLVVALLVAVASVRGAAASERSEILVAQGEVAYHAGRLDDAQRLFSSALEADPGDASARAWLDLLASRVPGAAAPGERREAAAKAWDLEAGTGVEYDSNVRLDPSDPRGDAAFLFTLAGHVDPYRDDRTLVRLDYDFFQSVHTSLGDFDYRSHRFRGTVSRAVVPALWLGLQGGYDHGTLGTHAYLQEPWVMPYGSFIEGDRGATQVMYRHGEADYLGSPFGGAPFDRDGPVDGVGLTQLLFFFDRRLAATAGYAYEEERPHKASGDDFYRHSHLGRVGVRFPAWWRTLVDVDYVYRWDDYTKPNSTSPTGGKRQDHGSYVTTAVRRPILPHLDAVASYYVTVNHSNLDLYGYDRHVVALELRYVF